VRGREGGRKREREMGRERGRALANERVYMFMCVCELGERARVCLCGCVGTRENTF